MCSRNRFELLMYRVSWRWRSSKCDVIGWLEIKITTANPRTTEIDWATRDKGDDREPWVEERLHKDLQWTGWWYLCTAEAQQSPPLDIWGEVINRCREGGIPLCNSGLRYLPIWTSNYTMQDFRQNIEYMELDLLCFTFPIAARKPACDIIHSITLLSSAPFYSRKCQSA